jgi:hypothetical protein
MIGYQYTFFTKLSFHIQFFSRMREIIPVNLDTGSVVEWHYHQRIIKVGYPRAELTGKSVQSSTV